MSYRDSIQSIAAVQDAHQETLNAHQETLGILTDGYAANKQRSRDNESRARQTWLMAFIVMCLTIPFLLSYGVAVHELQVRSRALTQDAAYRHEQVDALRKINETRFRQLEEELRNHRCH